MNNNACSCQKSGLTYSSACGYRQTDYDDKDDSVMDEIDLETELIR